LDFYLVFAVQQILKESKEEAFKYSECQEPASDRKISYCSKVGLLYAAFRQ